MKNPTPRELLIKRAATDHADGGTQWRDRMESWLSDRAWRDAHVAMDVLLYSGDFGTLAVVPAGKYFRPTRHV